LVNEVYNRYKGRITDDIDNNITWQQRFEFCCKNNLIPILNSLDEGRTVVILSSIMTLIRNTAKTGIDPSEMASLEELANTIGLKYGQKWFNGHNIRVAYGDVAKFLSFTDSEIKNTKGSRQVTLFSTTTAADG
jgi:hypothetical protein